MKLPMPFEHQEYNIDIKSKRDSQFSREKFLNQPLSKDVYKVPMRSSEEYGWLEPIDIFSNYGHGVKNMDGGVNFTKTNPSASRNAKK
jgi:hypothetical protein